MKYIFELDNEQQMKLDEWIAAGNRKESRATMGERLEYCFMPSSLGMHIIVRDGLTNESINLSDYEKW